MSTILISIPLDDSLRCNMEDVLNQKEISLTAADSMLRQFAFVIAQQKNALGFYNETEYLMSIPGMKDVITEGINTPLSDCLEEADLWADV